jgi:hypothetical protein
VEALFLPSLMCRNCCAIGVKAIEEEMNQWTNEQVALGQSRPLVTIAQTGHPVAASPQPPSRNIVNDLL